MEQTNQSQWRWFLNDGGPLIVLPREAAAFWEGGDLPANGRVVQANFRWNTETATDYDRACDIDDYHGVIDVGDSWGLVLHDEIPAAGWMKMRDGEALFLVRIIYCETDGDDEVHRCYRKLRDADWKRIAEKLPLVNGELILFHAAGRLDGSLQEVTPSDGGFALIGDAIKAPMAPGSYAIETADTADDDEARFMFYRFVLASA